MSIRIDVVIDVAPDQPYHVATLAALAHARDALRTGADIAVVTTDTIDADYLAAMPDGVVMGPGTPYRSPESAELVIRTARERGIPLVGT